jgi:hypothetical protein
MGLADIARNCVRGCWVIGQGNFNTLLLSEKTDSTGWAVECLLQDSVYHLHSVEIVEPLFLFQSPSQVQSHDG